MVHRFSATIEQLGTLYGVVVPVAIMRAIGVRGRVPVAVFVADHAPFHATLMPRRDGRHVLRLNAVARAGTKAGGRIAVTVEVADADRAVAVPEDLAAALREARARAGWEALPPGKREHIVHWIDEARFEATRAKRLVMAVEAALARQEKKRGKDDPS